LLAILALILLKPSAQRCAAQDAAQDAADPAAAVQGLLAEAIEAGQMAGAVVMVSRRHEVLFSTAVGDAQSLPHRRPMRLDTVFDLASLTKPIATATSIACLVDAGKVDFDRPVADYWPAFAAEGKAGITIADLLLHRGGLIADNALSDYNNGDAATWNRIAALKPVAPRGARFIYSDVGFLVLGKVVAEVSGQSLDQYASEHIFAPLQMTETGFLPTAACQSRAAATEQRNGEWLVGTVHDPRAARLGGVAGHAGLFSTATDLIRFGEALLQDDGKLFKAATRDVLLQPRQVPRGQRAYGWDIRSPYSSNRPSSFSEHAFGHGGFTGTVLWIDPDQQTVFVFLSNRLHPDGTGSVNRLAAQIADTLLPSAKRGRGSFKKPPVLKTPTSDRCSGRSGRFVGLRR